MRWATSIDGTIIYGIGRAVRAVYAENAETRAIVAKAEEAYAASPYTQRTIPQDIFVPGMISALLMRDTYPANPQPLSAFTMKELFARGDTERKALAIYNAVLASPLAFDDDGVPRNNQAIATELGLLWKQERLLRYPQNRASAGTLTVQQALPGALLRALGHRRSLLSTFTREARREGEARASAVSDKKEVSLPDAEGEAWESIVAAIETAAMRIGDKLREAAAEHRRAFGFQMREMAGMEYGGIPEYGNLPDYDGEEEGEAALYEEDDVEEEILNFQGQFLASLLRLADELFALIEPLLNEKTEEKEGRPGGRPSLEPASRAAQEAQTGGSQINQKSLKPDQQLLPQVKQVIEREEASVLRRFKQSLDKKRQRRAGIRRYIWRTQEDERVRASHAANDGKIFEWDSTPPTGHPGADYGCRCFAEPILDGAQETPTAETAFAILPAAVLTEEAVLLLINIAARLKQIQRGAATMRGANVLLDEIQQQEEEGQRDAEASQPPAGESAPTPEPPDDEELPEGDDKERNSKIAEKISDGHAYEKHVEKKGEFPDIESREDFKKHIEDVMNNPDDFKQLRNGREAYWDDETETIVISDPNNPDGGTAYRAYEGKQSYEKLE